MLRVNRPNLSSALLVSLDRWQQAVNNGEIEGDPWKRFHEQDRETKNAILTILKTTFHSKCAYCETADADEIEHFWPKSPHQQNDFRGTPQHMFTWENLLLVCRKCNSFSCKGSRMIWDDGNPRLLNPCLDEPLHYFTINVTYNSEFPSGYVEPRPDLSLVKQIRAEYTIHLLKLNQRSYLVEGRRKVLRDFNDWITILTKLGPEFELPNGTGTIRQRFLDMLDCYKPFLASIRQILHNDPERYTMLLTKIPELADVIAPWNLPVSTVDE